MKLLRFTGRKYFGAVRFLAPGEMQIGKEVSENEANRLTRDFPDRFSIIDSEPTTKKEMKPKKTREMKPTETK